MKILQINNYYKPLGGSEAVFFNTIELLETIGHSVIPFAANSAGQPPSSYSAYFPDANGGDSWSPSAFPRYLYNLAARKSMQQLLLDHAPVDLAHLHIYYGRLTASIIAPLKKRGIPIVQTLHEYKMVCPTYVMERKGQICTECVSGTKLRVLVHRCKNNSIIHSAAILVEHYASRLLGSSKHIDKFICVSEFQASILRRAGVAADKLACLPNFARTELFSAPPLDRSDYFFYFGRIEKLKGLRTLIEAFRAIGDRLLIAGSGSWSQELCNLIEDIPNIEYLGFKSGADLTNLIGRSRCVIVPSEWFENCPMSIIEAKALGTPVLGSNIGGIPEMVRDGVDGYLFEAGSAVDLQTVVEKFKRSSWPNMSFEAHQDALSRYSAVAHLDRLNGIYIEALK